MQSLHLVVLQLSDQLIKITATNVLDSAMHFFCLLLCSLLTKGKVTGTLATTDEVLGRVIANQEIFTDSLIMFKDLSIPLNIFLFSNLLLRLLKRHHGEDQTKEIHTRVHTCASWKTQESMSLALMPASHFM